MNIKIKKIIVREFLILMVVITVGLFSFLCTYPYNWNKSYQLKKVDEKITLQTHVADSISKSFNDKTMEGKDYISRVYWGLKEHSVDFGMPAFNYSEPDFRQKILSDKNFRENIYKTFQNRLEGFTKTYTQFDSSLNRQLTLNDIDQQKQSQLILENLKETRNGKEKISLSILTFNEQISFGIKILIFTAFVFFVLRFLFYAIKWSIKTMNQGQK